MTADGSRLDRDSCTRGFVRAAQYFANMLPSADVLAESREFIRGTFAPDVVCFCDRSQCPGDCGLSGADCAVLRRAVDQVSESGLMAMESLDGPPPTACVVLPVSVRGRTEAALVLCYSGERALPHHALEALLGVAALVGATLARQQAYRELLVLAEERAARQAAEAGAKLLEQANERLRLAALETSGAREREAEARTEAEYRQRELEAFFAAMVDAVVVHGKDGRIEVTNGAAAHLFGTDMRGLTSAEFLERARLRAPDGSTIAVDRLPSTLALGGAIVTGERLRVRSPAGDRIALVSASPVRSGEAPSGAVVVYRDVTEQDRAEQAVRDADRRKGEFLAVLSHELRNPLAPIRNCVYILERAVPGGDQARRAQTVIDRQVHHLTRLVDDLLDVTRISSGKIRLRRERLELNEFTRRCVEDQLSVFARNGVELDTVAAAQPTYVYGDPTRIAQMIGNLLRNAAKFTPRGGRATVSVRRVSEQFAAVHVRDTGEGIAPEATDHLFEPFVQAERTLDRSRGGLGLGLALVKGLAQLHDGTVTAHSDGPGKGAEFVLTLPLERRAAPRLDTIAAREGTRPPLRILIIEDNVDAADSLREVLEFLEHVVEVAATGIEGLEKARSFEPEVVLCDIGLPGMDGYEVARTMRSDPHLGAIPLVALSGYASAEDLEKAKQAGFDHHLAKPPRVEDLERALKQVTRAPPGPPSIGYRSP
jgi:PAS domain S-box-containing protein